MRLVLVMRHGQTDSPAGIKGRREYDLSVEGIKTIKMVGQLIEMMELEPAFIATGPLNRAQQTGKLLNEKNVPMQSMGKFDEIDVGDLTGSTDGIDLDEYDANAEKNHAETSSHAVSRAMKGLLELKQIPGKFGIVVTHSFLMTLLYLHLQKAEGMPFMIPMYNGCGFFVDLSTMTIIAPFPMLEEKENGETAGE